MDRLLKCVALEPCRALCARGDCLRRANSHNTSGECVHYYKVRKSGRKTIMRQLIVAVILSLFPIAVFALPSHCIVGTNVYYISQAGSDSNSQAQAKNKTTPWTHAPYMHSFMGSYSHTAGDCFVFRGNDTWNVGTTDYIVVANGGTSSSPDYYGVDQTWYSGSSWNRPLFSISGNLPNVDGNGESQVIAFNASFVTFDWIEMTGGTCSTKPVSENYFWTGSQGSIVVTNSYFHAFQPPSGGCGNTKTADGNNSGVWIYSEISGNSDCLGAFNNNVVDGTDGSGAKGYLTIVADPAPCATFAYNVIHDVCSGIGGNFTLAHDNTIGNFGGMIGQYECASSEGIHNHALRTNNDATLYNNNLYNTEGEVISVNPQSGGPGSYIFNNILWANNASAIDILDQGSATSGSVYIWNNTIEEQTGGDFVYGNCINLENSIGTLSIENEYHIFAADSQLGCILIANSPFNASGKGTVKTLVYNAANDLYQTITQANADGYSSSQTFAYSPTSLSSPTVGIGMNLTSSWPSGIVTNDTTFTCSEGTVNGVVQSVCPARTSNERPSSGAWDAGAYYFSNMNAPAPPTDLRGVVE